MQNKPKVLNLYAGIGGNRKLWDASVVAVELSSEIASIYSKLFPQDIIIIGDAHSYLIDHYEEFDFIWSSPPCQTHSKMDRVNPRNKPRYPDMSLYQEILFLKTYCKTKWVVENVKPYYKPLIPPTTQVGRHYFWSNFSFLVADVKRPSNFINLTTVAGAEKLKKWLGLEYEGNVYTKSSHCPAQVLRNCVHPKIGLAILKQAFC